MKYMVNPRFVTTFVILLFISLPFLQSCGSDSTKGTKTTDEKKVWIPYKNPKVESGSADCGDAYDLYTNKTKEEEDILYTFVVNCEFKGYWWVETGEENEVPDKHEIDGYGGKAQGSVALQPGETLVFQCSRVSTVANEGCTYTYKVASHR